MIYSRAETFKERLITPGLRVVLAYLALTYCFPSIVNSFINMEQVSAYRIYPIHITALLFVLGFAVALILLDKRESRLFQGSTEYRFSYQSIKWRLIVVVLCLIVAILGKHGQLNDFRYSEESAFSGGVSLVYFVALVPGLLKFEFISQVFFSTTGWESERRLQALIRFISLAALVLSINGTSTAFFAMVYAFYAFFPKTITAVCLKQNDSTISWKHLKNQQRSKVIFFIVAPAVFASVLLLGWILGETAKRGGDSEGVMSDVAGLTFFQWAIMWFLERVSSSYYSLLMTLHDFFLSHDPDFLANFLVPIKGFFYRLNTVLGQPFWFPKPAMSHLSRLNYELLVVFVREREGTSPGLLASFFLTFPFPLNLACLVGYCCLLIRLLNYLIGKMRALPSFLGVLLLVWPSLAFFESPLDLLLIFDDANFIVALFLILAIRIAYEDRKLNRLARQSSLRNLFTRKIATQE